MDDFARFILEHDGDDPARLLLSRSRPSGIDLDLAVSTIISRRHLAKKLPSWHSLPSLIYPISLAAEQCSSEETAAYKASLAVRILSPFSPTSGAGPADEHLPEYPSEEAGAAPDGIGTGRASKERAEQQEGDGEEEGTVTGRASEERTGEEERAGRRWRIADLTGGLGADSLAFAKAGAEVLYNEGNPSLAEAARYNFRQFGEPDILVSNRMVEKGNVAEILGDFAPDLIFIDPARRGGRGQRVFALEDCSPDLTAIKDELTGASRFILAKISPMADISLTVSKLSPHVREIHIVSSAGECKELLILLDREFEGECDLIAWQNGNSLRFKTSEEKHAVPTFPLSEEELTPQAYPLLFRPGTSLTKSGAFNLPCERFGLVKLAPDTHLYFSKSEVPALKGLGKFFKIKEILKMTGKTAKETGKRFPKAEVTARNIGMDGDSLRKKLGCKSGDDAHIFGAAISPKGAKTGKYLIIA